MSVTFNPIQDPKAKQAQDANGKAPADRAQDIKTSNFAALMQQAKSSKQAPAVGSKEDRIYKAVHTAAEKYNLPPALILGVIKQESGFKPEARSWCGAQGLMQLMPGTAKQMGVTDAYNIEQNVDGGSKYLREMLDTFGGDVKKAVAAYNAGPGNVKKYGGVPPFEETKKYVPAVLAHAEKFNNGAPISVTAERPVALAVAAPATSPSPKIDYNLVIEAIHSSDIMTQSAMSLAITSNVQPIDLPESKRTSDEPPPPPPPPRGMRV